MLIAPLLPKVNALSLLTSISARYSRALIECQNFMAPGNYESYMSPLDNSFASYTARFDQREVIISCLGAVSSFTG